MLGYGCLGLTILLGAPVLLVLMVLVSAATQEGDSGGGSDWNHCVRFDDTERGRGYFDVTRRDTGSATTLRGRVMVLALRLRSGDRPWTTVQASHAEAAVLSACAFFEREAARYHQPLDCDVVPLTIGGVGFELPTLSLLANDLVSDADAARLERAARQALEAQLGETLLQIVQSYRHQGYDSVAFLVGLPSASPRDFARPHASSGFRAEFAFLFFGDRPADAAFVSAHELAHLFGADDLYQLTPIDERDANDVMGYHCANLMPPAALHEANAYAVGWLSSPPERAYGF